MSVPSAMRDLLERLRALIFRRELDRELDEELRDHLERETEAQAHRGAADPVREARLALGNIARIREETREARGVRALDDLIADTRYALRAIRRNPAFSATVIAVLGLAIGAATAVYTVADRVLFAELPHPESERLVRVYQRYSGSNLGTISVVDIQGIAAKQRSFEAFGALRLATLTLTGTGAAELVGAGRVTPGFFAALRVTPAHGRALLPRDEATDAAPAVVVSHTFAERLLGGAGAAVGKAITLDGVSHDVVGVLGADEPRLAGIRADLWPVMRLPTPERRGPFGYRGIARLRDGVTLEEATRDLDRISLELFPIWQAGFQDSTARLAPVPLRESLVGFARSQVGLFAGAVALLLLLAVANVATLMLVRASAREHELAVRTALGAGRARIARLVMTECLMLALLAGAVGTALAQAGIASIERIAPNLPRLDSVRMGGESVAFGAALVIIVALLVSLGPLSVVLRARGGGAAALAGSARSGGARGTNAWRGGLVTLEFALAFPLLIGAGLLMNSFLRLQRVDLGFDPAGVHALEINLPSGRYGDPAAIATFWRRLEDRAAEEPSVAASGLAMLLPPDVQGNVNNFDLLDRPVAPGASQHLVPWSSVTNGFFDALGIRLLDGRVFTPGDSAGSPPVVVVSRGWATKYYPGESALGRQLYSGGCTTCPPTTVIGIVSDVHYMGLESSTDAVYVPLAQDGGTGSHLVVRSRAAAGASLAALRSLVASLDPELAPTDVVLEEQIRSEFADPRRWAALVGAFAIVGSVLAALGIFGLTSYAVRQRRREFGVRLALGAPPRSLLLLVVRGGMRFAIAGTALGLLLATLEARWLGSLLYGVTAMDPWTMALAAVALLAVALVACWLPGVRAARLRPLEAIGSD